MTEAVPSSSRIELHHDAGIVAALRSQSSGGAGDDRGAGRDRAEPKPSQPALQARAPKSAKPPKPKAELRCPRCGAGTLLTGSRGWGCSRWREGCRFVVWFEIAGKKLTTTQLRELVTKGATTKKLAGGVARLVLDVRGDPSVRVQR